MLRCSISIVLYFYSTCLWVNALPPDWSSHCITNTSNYYYTLQPNRAAEKTGSRHPHLQALRMMGISKWPHEMYLRPVIFFLLFPNFKGFSFSWKNATSAGAELTSDQAIVIVDCSYYNYNSYPLRNRLMHT